jgi:signal transduction histidine kinase
MRRVVIAFSGGGFCGLVASLILGFSPPAIADGTNTLEQPVLLTNLFQLRQCAEQKAFMPHPFRIVAEVLDADVMSGVLALSDSSGREFIQLDLRGQPIAPGTTVRLEGNGCGVKPKGFGLVILSGLVVDNDGAHVMTTESGKVFLHAGVNPITLQWFNGSGDSGLNVEYAGPGLRRRPIPSSALSRAKIEGAAGGTNSLAGLDYRDYEGAWEHLPDFARLHPVTTGIVTNFDLTVRTRNQGVALVFSGFINIPQEGIYTFSTTSDDGSRLFVGESSLDLQVLGSGVMPPAAEKMPATPAARSSRPWVTLEGKVEFAGFRESGGELVMRVGDDDLRVRILGGGDTVSNFLTGLQVRVSGIYQDVLADDGSRIPGMLLVSSWKAVRPVPVLEKSPAMVMRNEAKTYQSAEGTTSATAAFPAITTASAIKALTPELAKQGLPVTIRGVVTAVLADYLHGAVVQDSTKGIFISLTGIPDLKPLQRGEFYEIQGVTGPGSFAPLVVARRITHLGPGELPQPLHATREQLINGSLDTQYAEIEGVVTAVHDQQIAMLTEGGKVTLVLNDFESEELTRYENALVRIRGCAFAFFNGETRELDARLLRVMGGAVDVLQEAPRDLFDASQKSIGELLLYDPQAAPFRRLKVSAQVIHGRPGEFFLTDGTNGIRVTTGSSNALTIGDQVEAVGFLDLGGPAAELKDAVMRKTGRAALPAPTRLLPERQLLARYAGTLVQVEATLMNQWREGPEYALELQSGFLAFRARIDSHGQSIPLPPSGSRLELTGVYAPRGDRAGDGTVSGFELLLNSPADLRVLATPPWWNLKHVLALVGLLAALLCAVLLWNKELHRKVQERGRQLELEVHHRQRAELQRAAEAERSRIARDLHDELGAGLTEVTLLASAGLGEFQDAEKNSGRLRAVAEKARTLVSGLDVIVWAIDPKRGSLQSFTDYVGRYTTRLFSATDIVCRFKIPIECNAITLTEAVRHNLFLAVKEALNNVIRHASATEVELHISQPGDSLQIVIADNGRGFDRNAVRPGHGLTNLQERLEALHGQCHLESKPGKGTTVKFIVPLPGDPNHSTT